MGQTKEDDLKLPGPLAAIIRKLHRDFSNKSHATSCSSKQMASLYFVRRTIRKAFCKRNPAKSARLAHFSALPDLRKQMPRTARALNPLDVRLQHILLIPSVSVRSELNGGRGGEKALSLLSNCLCIYAVLSLLQHAMHSTIARCVILRTTFTVFCTHESLPFRRCSPPIAQKGLSQS